MAKRVLLGAVLLGAVVLVAVLLRIVLPLLPSGYSSHREQPNPTLPDYLKVIESKPSWQPPHPKAPEAPRWSPAMAASNQPAASSTSTADDHLPKSLGNVRVSHPPAAFNLPLDYEFPNAPQVPKNISEPSAVVEKKR